MIVLQFFYTTELIQSLPKTNIGSLLNRKNMKNENNMFYLFRQGFSER